MRKENRTYYFSVEGETEKWYLDWLQKEINANYEAKYTVKLDSKIEKDPFARVKNLSVFDRTKITHIVDKESEDDIHVNQFLKTLDRMQLAQTSGKSIEYYLGYSNFTFELWLILHKTDCNGSLSHRSQYLIPLNKAYNTKFEDLAQYKEKDNFNRILDQLTLNCVCAAIKRSKAIMKNNRDVGYTLHKYKKYEYYKENPSLSVWESIDKILSECELSAK